MALARRMRFVMGVALVAGCGGSGTDAPDGSGVPWSREPPGGLAPSEVPQLVAITFDDNFGLAHPAAVGGVTAIVDFFRDRRNPDGAPAHVSLYHTSIYAVDSSQVVLGGQNGEDREGRNRAAWTAAFEAGHEAGDHTVHHFNGGVVPLDPDPCCQARDWSVDEWRDEIAACRDTLTDPAAGIGARTEDVIGFRTPFLGYNDHVFTALSELGFAYDTTLPNCFDDDEDGSNCSWPYTLDEGSPDVEVLARKFSASPIAFPEVTAHPGLWELSPTTLVIPPDTAADQYRFSPGLRDRVTARAPLPYPSLYEPSTGKIAGLDYTLLIDAGLTGDEMAAVLEYNLDLHLAGNRAPMIFVGHAHLYTFSTADDNPDTPTAEIREERWRGLTRFAEYALSKPEVQVVAARDVLAWMQAASTN